MLENSEKKQKSSSILLLNKLIFKKYKIAQQKSEGIFGQTYIVVNINTNKFYEMKVESKDSNYKILKVEAYNLYSIKGLGIPEFITFGILNNNNILIEELLGKSLLEIFKEYNYNFSIQDICLISIQLLDRLEWIHSKTLIHRDLKPENFLIGIKDKNNIIYLKEFGLCAKYCSSKTGKHIIPGFRGTFTGTLKFCSANAQRGNHQSRRDDIESLGYSIIFFMKGKLPWDNFNQKYNEKELYLKTYAMKKYIPVERLCKGLPIEMEEYFKYVRNLKFQEEPNYGYLRDLFKKILKNNGIDNYENINLSWVNASQNGQSRVKKKRTLSPKTRLYLKIKNQMLNKEIESENNFTNGNIINNKTPNKNIYAQSHSFTQADNNIISQIQNKNKINNIKQKKHNNFLSSDFGNSKENIEDNINNIENIENIKIEKSEIPEKKEKKEKEVILIEKYPTSREIYNKKYINNININKKEQSYSPINIDKANKNKNDINIKKNILNGKGIDINKISNNINNDVDNLKIKKISPKLNNYNINRYNSRYSTTVDNKQYLKIDQNKIYENNKLHLKPTGLNNNKLNLTNNNYKDSNFINFEQKKNYNIKNKEYIKTDNNIFDQKAIIKNINNNRYMNASRGGKNENIINANLNRNNNKYPNINNKSFNNNPFNDNLNKKY